jgi:hypothetical protein
MATKVAKMPRSLFFPGLTNWKFRDAECANTTYVGARRPCTDILGRRVRKCNARNVIARPIIA